MREIPISHGKVALVDDADYEAAAALAWQAIPMNHLWYAYNAKHKLWLHWLVLGKPPTGLIVDHKNGDGLDCQRGNVRFATNTQNQHNARLRVDNTSGYRGVYRFEGKWKADIRINGKKVFLGIFTDPKEAARAYDARVRETRGEFGRTNFEREEK